MVRAKGWNDESVPSNSVLLLSDWLDTFPFTHPITMRFEEHCSTKTSSPKDCPKKRDHKPFIFHHIKKNGGKVLGLGLGWVGTQAISSFKHGFMKPETSSCTCYAELNPCFHFSILIACFPLEFGWVSFNVHHAIVVTPLITHAYPNDSHLPLELDCH